MLTVDFGDRTCIVYSSHLCPEICRQSTLTDKHHISMSLNLTIIHTPTSGKRSRKVTWGVAFDRTTFALISEPSSSITPVAVLLSSTRIWDTGCVDQVSYTSYQRLSIRTSAYRVSNQRRSMFLCCPRYCHWDSTISTLSVAPGILNPLQLPHHMMQQDISAWEKWNISKANSIHVVWHLKSYIYTDPLPGSLGLSMAPITASVASVAFRGSDSNHLSKMCWRQRTHESVAVVSTCNTHLWSRSSYQLIESWQLSTKIASYNEQN